MEVVQSLGKYEIRGTLGRGAMGVVYDGFDPQIARRVAIKTVPLPENPDPETAEEIARFRREAQAAGRLTHPNIVTVYDYGETKDLAYIVMEFVDGPSLKGLLDKRERFALDKIAQVMADLLGGLQFSHERGVVHRDIKPANVMLTSAGQAKIADFGIARIEASSMTQAGTMLGTPAYMSPEQFMGQVVDARTDVYSSGALLYQLLTGERPFDGSLTTIMHKVLNTDPLPPSQLAVTVPAALDAVVKRAMAKRPEERYPSAAAFAEAIHAVLADPKGKPAAAAGADAGATLVARSAAKPAPAAAPGLSRGSAAAAKPPFPAPARSRAPLLAAVAALVVILAGGAFFLFHAAAPPGPAPQKLAEAAPSPSSSPSPAPEPAPAQAAQPAQPQAQPTPPEPLAQVQPPASQAQPAPPEPPPQVQPPASQAQPAPPVPLTQVQPPASQVQPAPPVPLAQVQPPAPQVQPAPPVPLAQVQPPSPEVQPLAPAAAPQVQPPPQEVQPPAAAKLPPAMQPPPAPPAPVEPVAVTPAAPAPAVKLPPVVPPPAAPAAPAEPMAAPQRPATPPPPPAPSVQAEAGGSAALRQQVGQALSAARCALADATVQDSGRISVAGLAGSSGAASLQNAVAAVASGHRLDWRVRAIDPVFCPALATLHPIAPLAGAPSEGLVLALENGRTTLRDGERILPRITMAGFGGELLVDYLGHDGSLLHLFPTVADPVQHQVAVPARYLLPGARLSLGNNGPGQPEWEVGPPYGTDMIIAVASSAPLFAHPPPRNAEDDAGPYLKELAAAIAAARNAGAHVTGTELLVDTLAKGK